MIMQIAPEDQGQIVETSYGWYEGSLYMRISDRSDRTTAWYLADQDKADTLPEDWEPINGAPDFTGWTPCAEPQGVKG